MPQSGDYRRVSWTISKPEPMPWHPHHWHPTTHVATAPVPLRVPLHGPAEPAIVAAIAARRSSWSRAPGNWPMHWWSWPVSRARSARCPLPLDSPRSPGGVDQQVLQELAAA